jgi:hypothetical protein
MHDPQKVAREAAERRLTSPQDRSRNPVLPPDTLTSEEEQQWHTALEWLKDKWGEPAPECPYCRAKNWSVGVPGRAPRGERVTGWMALSFPVVCTNCGNTVFVDAVLAGVVPESESEK